VNQALIPTSTIQKFPALDISTKDLRNIKIKLIYRLTNDSRFSIDHDILQNKSLCLRSGKKSKSMNQLILDQMLINYLMFDKISNVSNVSKVKINSNIFILKRKFNIDSL